MTEPQEPTIEISGATWHDEDIALDVNGRIWQLQLYVSAVHRGRREWYWYQFGTEYDWAVGAPPTEQGPKGPFRRMRLVPAEPASVCVQTSTARVAHDGAAVTGE